MRPQRLIAALLLLVALVGCRDASPPDRVDSEGAVTTPAVRPLWLLRSTGTAESSEYGVDSQGLFVAGDVAVYHALDTVLGVSTADGRTVWRSPVDLRGATIRAAGTRDGTSPSPRWSFVATVRGRDHVITLDTRTARLVRDVRRAAGFVGALTSDGDTDYVAGPTGIFRIDARGVPRRITGPLGDVSRLSLVHGTHVAVLQTSATRRDPSVVAGVDLTSGELLWRRPVSGLTPLPDGVSLQVHPQDGRYLAGKQLRGSELHVHLVTLDPRTGRVRATADLPQRSYRDTDHALQVHPDDVGPGAPDGLTVVGDDVVVRDNVGISRYRPLSDEIVWTLRAGAMTTRHGIPAAIGLGPLSPDGRHVLAMLSSGSSGDVLTVDVRTGRLVSRWAMDDTLDAGLTTYPLMAGVGDHLLLARNRDVEGDPALVEPGAAPLGPVNDLGWFSTPRTSR